MGIKIQIKNIDEFKKFIEDKQKNMQKILPESVNDATLYLQNQIKMSIAQGTNAPVTVDTGRFLNSVDFEATGENESKVFTDLEYAKFLEYGTSKMASRPHFRNTAMVEEANIKQVFNNNLKSL